jgi:hypothetical protein
MLANRAELKSKQKMLTYFSREFSNKSKIQLIIPLSTNVGMTLSLTELFCRIAIQNL